MTASVKYWRLPEEEAEMVEYLSSVEPTMALPARRVSTPEELVWKPIEEALREPDHAFLITPSRFVPEMTVHQNDEGFAANVNTTPALFYSRGRLLSPNRLSSTALSGDWSHLATDKTTSVDMPSDYVRWAKNVLQWVRGVAPGWHMYKSQRITPKAEAARDAGMELVL